MGYASQYRSLARLELVGRYPRPSTFILVALLPLLVMVLMLFDFMRISGRGIVDSFSADFDAVFSRETVCPKTDYPLFYGPRGCIPLAIIIGESDEQPFVTALTDSTPLTTFGSYPSAPDGVDIHIFRTVDDFVESVAGAAYTYAAAVIVPPRNYTAGLRSPFRSDSMGGLSDSIPGLGQFAGAFDAVQDATGMQGSEATFVRKAFSSALRSAAVPREASAAQSSPSSVTPTPLPTVSPSPHIIPPSPPPPRPSPPGRYYILMLNETLAPSLRVSTVASVGPSAAPVYADDPLRGRGLWHSGVVALSAALDAIVLRRKSGGEDASFGSGIGRMRMTALPSVAPDETVAPKPQRATITPAPPTGSSGTPQGNPLFPLFHSAPPSPPQVGTLTPRSGAPMPLPPTPSPVRAHREAVLQASAKRSQSAALSVDGYVQPGGAVVGWGRGRRASKLGTSAHVSDAGERHEVVDLESDGELRAGGRTCALPQKVRWGVNGRGEGYQLVTLCLVLVGLVWALMWHTDAVEYRHGGMKTKLRAMGLNDGVYILTAVGSLAVLAAVAVGVTQAITMLADVAAPGYAMAGAFLARTNGFAALGIWLYLVAMGTWGVALSQMLFRVGAGRALIIIPHAVLFIWYLLVVLFEVSLSSSNDNANLKSVLLPQSQMVVTTATSSVVSGVFGLATSESVLAVAFHTLLSCFPAQPAAESVASAAVHSAAAVFPCSVTNTAADSGTVVRASAYYATFNPFSSSLRAKWREAIGREVSSAAESEYTPLYSVYFGALRWLLGHVLVATFAGWYYSHLYAAGGTGKVLPLYYPFMPSFWAPKGTAAGPSGDAGYTGVGRGAGGGGADTYTVAKHVSRGGGLTTLKLSRLFAKKRAFSEVSLALQRGSVYALLGHNGAGKTTLVNVLCGRIPPTFGSVFFDGNDCTDSLSVWMRETLGVCEQDNVVWGDLSAWDHLLFFGLFRGKRSREEVLAKAEKYLTKLGLWEWRFDKVRTFSGGMKRRLCVALSVIDAPNIIVLDEPTTGLDPLARRIVWDFIRSLRADGNVVLLTTHAMDEAEALGDRVIIMADGRVKAVGSVAELKARRGHGTAVHVQMTRPSADPETQGVVAAMAREATAACPTLRVGVAPNGAVTLRVSHRARAQVQAVLRVVEKYIVAQERGAHIAGGAGGVPPGAEVGVGEWSVSSSSLEEIFLQLTSSRGLRGGTGDGDAVLPVPTPGGGASDAPSGPPGGVAVPDRAAPGGLPPADGSEDPFAVGQQRSVPCLLCGVRTAERAFIYTGYGAGVETASTICRPCSLTPPETFVAPHPAWPLAAAAGGTGGRQSRRGSRAGGRRVDGGSFEDGSGKEALNATSGDSVTTSAVATPPRAIGGNARKDAPALTPGGPLQLPATPGGNASPGLHANAPHSPTMAMAAAAPAVLAPHGMPPSSHAAPHGVPGATPPYFTPPREAPSQGRVLASQAAAVARLHLLRLKRRPCLLCCGGCCFIFPIVILLLLGLIAALFLPNHSLAPVCPFGSPDLKGDACDAAMWTQLASVQPPSNTDAAASMQDRSTSLPGLPISLAALSGDWGLGRYFVPRPCGGPQVLDSIVLMHTNRSVVVPGIAISDVNTSGVWRDKDTVVTNGGFEVLRGEVAAADAATQLQMAGRDRAPSREVPPFEPGDPYMYPDLMAATAAASAAQLPLSYMVGQGACRGKSLTGTDRKDCDVVIGSWLRVRPPAPSVLIDPGVTPSANEDGDDEVKNTFCSNLVEEYGYSAFASKGEQIVVDAPFDAALAAILSVRAWMGPQLDSLILGFPPVQSIVSDNDWSQPYSPSGLKQRMMSFVSLMLAAQPVMLPAPLLVGMVVEDREGGRLDLLASNGLGMLPYAVVTMMLPTLTACVAAFLQVLFLVLTGLLSSGYSLPVCLASLGLCLFVGAVVGVGGQVPYGKAISVVLFVLVVIGAPLGGLATAFSMAGARSLSFFGIWKYLFPPLGFLTVFYLGFSATVSFSSVLLMSLGVLLSGIAWSLVAVFCILGVKRVAPLWRGVLDDFYAGVYFKHADGGLNGSAGAHRSTPNTQVAAEVSLLHNAAERTLTECRNAAARRAPPPACDPLVVSQLWKIFSRGKRDDGDAPADGGAPDAELALASTRGSTRTVTGDKRLCGLYTPTVFAALRGVSLTAKRGEVLGLLGPNGAGKSTLVNAIAGNTGPAAGGIVVGGRVSSYTYRPELDTASGVRSSGGFFGKLKGWWNTSYAQNVGVCPQYTVVWPTLTVQEHLHLMQSIRGGGGANAEACARRAAALVALDGDDYGCAGGTLSGGTARRLCLAMALVAEPAVVLLDEPSTGLDIDSKNAVWRCVRSAASFSAVVLSTHSMAEADALCDRISIIASGQLRCIGSSVTLKAQHGGGVRVRVSVRPGCDDVVGGVLAQALGCELKLCATIGSLRTYGLSCDVSLSSLYAALHSAPVKGVVSESSIQHESLDDVFVKVVNDAAAEAGVVASSQ